MVGMQPEKLHAACDECRTRKLKCSGDAPACSRCERENITCVYSPRKPMGRPRKRRREDVPPEEAQEGQLEPSPTVDDFPMQTFGDGGLIPQPDLSVDFPGFEGVPVNDAFSSGMIPPSYIETFGQLPAQHPSFDVDSIDPLLWDQQPNDPGFDSQTNSTPGQADTGPCTCLSIMYLALTDLQALNNFSFPAVVPRLRPALITASTIIHCPKCPMETFSSIQNIQSLYSLLSAIAERFHKVIAAIDAEATSLEQSGEKKSFRIGDNSLENVHLHTGQLDCPMGYNIKLDAQDWKKLAKQMLRTEVMGGGQNSTPLIGLIDELEKRQDKWHHDAHMHTEERTRLFGAQNLCISKGKEAMCSRMIGHIRTMVEQMNWE